MTAPVPRLPYADVLAGNVRAARGRADLGQDALAARMRELGFAAWLRQTVASVEKARRRVTAEEIFGLALALETTIPALTSTSDHAGFVQLPNGKAISAISMERLAGRGLNDHAVQWKDGGTSALIFTLHTQPGTDPFDRAVLGPQMDAQGWPPGDAEPEQ